MKSAVNERRGVTQRMRNISTLSASLDRRCVPVSSGADSESDVWRT